MLASLHFRLKGLLRINIEGYRRISRILPVHSCEFERHPITMLVITIVSALLAVSAAAPTLTDDACIDYDGEADHLFDKLRTSLASAASETIEIGNLSDTFAGFGIVWIKGIVGNFSSIGLGEKRINNSASALCATSASKTLIINVGFDSLSVSFDKFTIETPFVSIGGGKTSLSLRDENLAVSVSTFSDVDPKTGRSSCVSAALNNFEFTNWGKLTLELEGNLINEAISWIFNTFMSRAIVNLLNNIGAGNVINSYAQRFLRPVFQNRGQLICELIQYS